jgi:branched-chain amino acid transport system substrate-binding protein
VRRATLLLSAVAALATGCGDDSEPSTRVAGDRLTIYASLPAHGPDAEAGRGVEAGMRRALADADGRASGRTVRLVRLPSTRPGDDRWDPGTVEANAERAVDDPRTIAYLGELDQGASAVSLPVTNRRGLVQVSPADGLTSLTRTPPGRPRAGPERYYPEGRRTFVRLVPPDLDAAREIVRSLRARGSQRLAVLHEDGIADRELEAMVLALIGTGSPRTVVRAGVRGDAPDEIADLLEEVAVEQPDAILYAGPSGPISRTVLAALAARLPDVPVLGGPPLAVGSGFAQAPAEGCALTGVPRSASLDARGRRLLADLRHANGRDVGPEALLGYEAMRLALDAIERGGPDRLAVAKAARAHRTRDSPVGSYAVGRRGEVSRPLACVALAASAR